MSESTGQPKGHTGKFLVTVFFPALFLLVFAVTWLTVHHPKTKAFHEGDLIPLRKCIGIIDAERIRIEGKEEEYVVRFAGIQHPSRQSELISSDLDVAHEDEVARKVLLTWIFRKRVEIKHPGDTPQYDADGNLLAYVEVFGVDAGKKLIDNGQMLVNDFDHPRREVYVASQKEARQAELGIWRKK